MAYKVTDSCLKCGYCIERCPEGAFVADEKINWEGLILQPVHIDSEKCTDCGICISEEYWCPAQAVVEAQISTEFRWNLPLHSRSLKHTL